MRELIDILEGNKRKVVILDGEQPSLPHFMAIRFSAIHCYVGVNSDMTIKHFIDKAREQDMIVYINKNLYDTYKDYLLYSDYRVIDNFDLSDSVINELCVISKRDEMSDNKPSYVPMLGRELLGFKIQEGVRIGRPYDSSKEDMFGITLSDSINLVGDFTGSMLRCLSSSRYDYKLLKETEFDKLMIPLDFICKVNVLYNSLNGNTLLNDISEYLKYCENIEFTGIEELLKTFPKYLEPRVVRGLVACYLKRDKIKIRGVISDGLTRDQMFIINEALKIAGIRTIFIFDKDINRLDLTTIITDRELVYELGFNNLKSNSVGLLIDDFILTPFIIQ